VSPATGIAGSLIATGTIAILGATFWWFKDIFSKEPLEEDDFDEPVAMGFGDVKLAAILGVILGWQNLLVALMLSFIIGAVGGIASKFAGGGRIIPFGPYLAIGGMVALFYGADIVSWYLNLLGVS